MRRTNWIVVDSMSVDVSKVDHYSNGDIYHEPLLIFFQYRAENVDSIYFLECYAICCIGDRFHGFEGFAEGCADQKKSLLALFNIDKMERLAQDHICLPQGENDIPWQPSPA